MTRPYASLRPRHEEAALQAPVRSRSGALPRTRMKPMYTPCGWCAAHYAGWQIMPSPMRSATEKTERYAA